MRAYTLVSIYLVEGVNSQPLKAQAPRGCCAPSHGDHGRRPAVVGEAVGWLVPAGGLGIAACPGVRQEEADPRRQPGKPEVAENNFGLEAPRNWFQHWQT